MLNQNRAEREWGVGSGEWGKEITFPSPFPIPHSHSPLPTPHSPLPTPLDEFFLKRLPGARRLWRSRILTVKFRNDNQQTKFRVTDGTEVHCFKSVRARSDLKLR